MSVTLPSRATQ